MFTEDLAAMFDTADFALAATLNGVASGNVIMDREYLRQLGIVSGSEPTVLAIASEYAASAIGGALVVSGTSYTITEREPIDDGALVLLRLEATA